MARRQEVDVRFLLHVDTITDWLAVGNDHPDTAESYRDLGDLRVAQEQLSAAEKAYLQSLGILDKLGKPPTDLILDTQKGLVQSYLIGRNFRAAEPWLTRLLAQRDKFQGRLHPEVVDTLGQQVLVYTQLGKTNDLIACYGRLIDLKENVRGAEHVEVADYLVPLAELYLQQQQPAKAEELWLRALAIYQTFYGPDHLMLLTPLTKLIALYTSQGKNESLGPLYPRALTVMEKRLGKNNPAVANYVDEYAAWLQRNNQVEEAARQTARAEAMRNAAKK